jgi:hypothetical protein
MRLLYLFALFLFVAGCDKPVHEARTPIDWTTVHQR